VEPEESLSEAFWAVARELRHRSRDALEPYQISPSQSRALGTLQRHGLLRPGELAQKLRIAPRSATEVVDDLQQLGLVERRPDPADRRATLIALTGKGEQTAAAIQRTRQSEADGFFGALNATDRGELARILRKLRAGTAP
jgi:DNA-binding MarR family transcriptional regulator